MVTKKFCDFCHSEFSENSYEIEIAKFGNNLDICDICLEKINKFLEGLGK